MKLARIVLLICAVAAPALGACGSSGAVHNTIDDATISTRVKTALLNEPDVAALRITVTSSGGVVTLSGAVKTAGEEQRAIAVARSIEGVRDVKSQLKIEQAPGAYMPTA
jgi:hyperosmotically inducible protein